MSKYTDADILAMAGPGKSFFRVSGYLRRQNDVHLLAGWAGQLEAGAVVPGEAA